MSQTILIVEDMPDTQAWLRGACEIAFPGAAILVASSLEEGQTLSAENQPDLALLDLELPDGRGNTFIPQLLEQHPACLCIIVTIYADEEHLLPSLAAGARGYILKDQSRERIAEMLRQAVAGELPLSPSVASMVLEQFTQKPEESEQSPLTSRENDVLALIASGSSTPDVARLLNISKYTAEDHIKQIYRKLHISSRAEAALAARRYKLI